MKKCESCNIMQENGKFCAKCGGKLVEVIVESVAEDTCNDSSDIKQNIEQIKVNKKQEKSNKTSSEPKKKKKVSVFKIIMLMILVLFISFIGVCVYYINDSQVNISSNYNFDNDEFIKDLYTDKFDGESFEIVLDKDIIRYYIDENFNKNDFGELSLDLRITNIAYSSYDYKFYIQLDNDFIHTSIIAKIGYNQVENKLFIEQESLSLGKWNIPLSYNLIKSLNVIPENMTNGIEIPTYLSISAPEYNKKEIIINVDLSLDYFESVIKESFEKFDDEYIDFARNYNFYLKQIVDFKDKKDEWSKEDTKEFMMLSVSDYQFLVAYMSLLKDEYRDEFIAKLVRDSIYIEEDFLSELVKKIKVEKKLFVDSYYQKINENIIIDIKNYANKVNNTIYDYHDNFYMSNRLISLNGMPYSTNLQEIISLETINEFGQLKPSDDYSYELMYKDQLYVGVQTSFGYYTINESNKIKKFDTEIEAHNWIGFNPTKYVPNTEFLNRGSNDRITIAAAVSDYIYSDNSIFTRYLKSDGKWAFIIASSGNYSQSINQYILMKVGGNWEVMLDYGENEIVYDRILNDLDGFDFNVKLLPNFEVADYDIWNVSYNDMDDITWHLSNLGELEYDDIINYLSRVDDVLVISYESGKKFIFKYEYDSQYTYEDLKVLGNTESYSDYIYILNNEYYGNIPSFVFLQN